LFLRRPFANQIADNHQPGRDADARLQRDGFDIEAADSVDDTQPSPDRTLGIVLVCSRVAEINQHSVAHILGDKPIEASDDVGDGAVVGGDNLAQILGIEPRRQLGRPDQIAEHHGQLPAFGLHPHLSLPRRRGRVKEAAGIRRHIAGEGGNRVKQPAPVTDGGDTQLA
jgi:hypothetical protein